MRFLYLIGVALTIVVVPTISAATEHVVKKGDTLYGIGKRYGVTTQELIEANPGIKPERLRIGQKVKLPGTEKPDSPKKDPDPPKPVPDKPPTPQFHTVKKGDTLTRIALQYGVRVADLRSWNGLKSDLIRVGQKLRVQSKDGAAPKPSSAKKPEQVEAEQKFVFLRKVKAQIDKANLKKRRWRYIVIHHSGTRSGNAKIFDYYHRRVRGMENGMAYHFVIGNGSDSGDGQIEVGARWTHQLQGGHLRSEEQNEVAIGICLVGDFNKDKPTRKQIASIIELVSYLNDILPREPKFVMHRDINVRPTDCPGKKFPATALKKLFRSRPAKKR